ncbi:MAG: DUF5953 family protein [Acidobacteriota bacterium]|nr:DUF5953 family protein [Acidobacteriota bacterium]
MNFLLFAPADPEGARISLAARAVEELLPATSLDLTLSAADALTPVGDREQMMRDTAQRQEVPILTDRDRDHPVLFSGAYWPAIVAPGGKLLLQLILQTSRITGSTLAGDLLGRLGDALHAYWGVATPRAAASTIAAQVIHDPARDSPPPGLPALQSWSPQVDPAVPSLLGWWNYWPREAIERLGTLPPNAISLPSGAVAWSVTDEPLDLSRAEHLTALADAYARWPRIGNRQSL